MYKVSEIRQKYYLLGQQAAMLKLAEENNQPKSRSANSAKLQNKNEAEKNLQEYLMSPRVSDEVPVRPPKKSALDDIVLGKLKVPKDKARRGYDEYAAANPGKVKKIPKVYGGTLGFRF